MFETKKSNKWNVNQHSNRQNKGWNLLISKLTKRLDGGMGMEFEN
jgi:hypothetical protein